MNDQTWGDVMITESARARIGELTVKYGGKREDLLQLLETLNREFLFLDEDIINEVAKFYKISQTEVYSVASFYHLLGVTPQGKNVIHLCKTISCELKGKTNIVKALESELQIKMGETTSDKNYTLQYANCMGACDKGPAMLVNDTLYTDLTPSKAVEIINSYRSKGGNR